MDESGRALVGGAETPYISYLHDQQPFTSNTRRRPMRKLLVVCVITGLCAAFFIAGFMFQKASNAERDGNSLWSKHALFSFSPANVCAAGNVCNITPATLNELKTRCTDMCQSVYGDMGNMIPYYGCSSGCEVFKQTALERCY